MAYNTMAQLEGHQTPLSRGTEECLNHRLPDKESERVGEQKSERECVLQIEKRASPPANMCHTVANTCTNSSMPKGRQYLSACVLTD